MTLIKPNINKLSQIYFLSSNYYFTNTNETIIEPFNIKNLSANNIYEIEIILNVFQTYNSNWNIYVNSDTNITSILVCNQYDTAIKILPIYTTNKVNIAQGSTSMNIYYKCIIKNTTKFYISYIDSLGGNYCYINKDYAFLKIKQI